MTVAVHSPSDAERRPLRVVIVGAGYGLLPAAKIALAGHRVTIVGRPGERDALGRDGIGLRFEGRDRRLHVPPARISAVLPADADPEGADLALLAVQEPQMAAPEMADLLRRFAARVPVASLMNLPPPPFLDRLSDAGPRLRRGVYAEAAVWDGLPPERFTHASPDPQALRLDPARPSELTVTLASNFRFAPFADADAQAVLSRLCRSASRAVSDGARSPVNLVARGSLFVPLSKWPMLVTGNCRCVTGKGGTVGIAEAVERDPGESRLLYDAVCEGLRVLGAAPADLVGFDAYRAAARALTRPSSLARALAAGRVAVERIDRLVLNLLDLTGADADARALMRTVSTRIDRAVERNRADGGGV